MLPYFMFTVFVFMIYVISIYSLCLFEDSVLNYLTLDIFPIIGRQIYKIFKCDANQCYDMAPRDRYIGWLLPTGTPSLVLFISLLSLPFDYNVFNGLTLSKLL